MLCEVIEQIPFAMLVTDMRVPGLPITCCNAAMAKLTGYDKGDIYGRNCKLSLGLTTSGSARCLASPCLFSRSLTQRSVDRASSPQAASCKALAPRRRPCAR